MSHSYQAVGWNRQKRIYDSILATLVLTYLGLFVGIGLATHPQVTIETLLIRALGTCAFLLLHVILAIGPLARLDVRFLPWLYNRRHLGVTMFLLALAHGLFSLFQFHALGNKNPLVSLFVSNGRYSDLAQFPFQPLGFFALVILFLMAATSHDFWLANLTAPVWKSLHMLVYVAYLLLVAHVALGVLQAERNPLLAGAVVIGVAVLCTLHLTAALRGRAVDRTLRAAADEEGYVRVCSVEEIEDQRARIVTLSGERVAVFRHSDRISAVSNVCQHQNGPLGEGKIVDGCITCPWHGYQYDPESGASPPPFTEKIPVFRVKVRDGDVYVHPSPLPPGTWVSPAPLEPRALADPKTGGEILGES